MNTTYHAMLEHGYPNLSISIIADELGKTKASIYYHYDSKEELLISFLDFVVDRFKIDFMEAISESPGPTLDNVIERQVPLQLIDEEFYRSDM